MRLGRRSLRTALPPLSQELATGIEQRPLAGALVAGLVGAGLQLATGLRRCVRRHGDGDRTRRALMLDPAAWLATGDWLSDTESEDARQNSAREFAVRSLERLRRKVKKDGRDLQHTDDEARHEVRKDAKKLRYAAEFFRSLFGRKAERRRYKKFIAGLEDLQDKLGALNDLATAPAVLNDLGLADHPESTSLSTSRKKALIEAAADSHDELIDTKRFW